MLLPLAATLCAVACVATLADAVSLDTTIGKHVEEAVKRDAFFISLAHVKAKRRIVHAPETLFSLDFPGSDQKFALKLDRRTKRVIVETLEDGRHRLQHFTVDTLHEDSIIRSLILAINQTQPGAHATLYLDCVSYGMVATPRSIRDMYNSMAHPQLEVFREKKYPMTVDGHKDLRMVLSKNDCPLLPEDNYEDSFKSEMGYLQDDPYIVQKNHRSDIPIITSPDINSVIDALNRLIVVVNKLNLEVGQHSLVIDQLRHLIEECELCKSDSRPGCAVLPTCATHNPCAPLVRCEDTPTGPRCGPCPPGHLGDGFHCRPGRSCRDQPCAAGVRCTDSAEHGFRCGPCPPGFEGDGERCRRVNRCEFNPCAPGCVPIWGHQKAVETSPRLVSPYYRHPNY